MTVLVLTSDDDVTADLVVDQLNQAGAPVLRVDPARYPADLKLTTEVTADRIKTVLDTGRTILDLDDVQSVWHRRPGTPGVATAEQSEWVALECARHWWGAMRTIPADRWMNSLDAIERSRYKPWQLQQLRQAGLNVPRTLFGNDPAAAERFADHGPLIAKSISGRHPEDPPITIPTVRVPATADFAGVADCATCLQDEIDKKYDVRLTVVGGDMYACQIVSGVLDWRWLDQSECTWQPIPVPGPVAVAVRRCMATVGVVYAAFDFAITADETWWCLEWNQGGQFGFIELETGQPIAAAIARWLVRLT